MIVRHRLVVALFGLLALTAAACGSSSASPAEQEPVTVTEGPAEVSLEDSAFTPANLRAPAGTTVTWTWNDGSTMHNVVGDGFESPVQEQGAFEHRFDDPGTYTYECTLHRRMDGIVEVTE
ncbi:MAG: cupredoxin domain-containing protein [Egibacteraceae bacterium]